VLPQQLPYCRARQANAAPVTNCVTHSTTAAAAGLFAFWRRYVAARLACSTRNFKTGAAAAAALDGAVKGLVGALTCWYVKALNLNLALPSAVYMACVLHLRAAALRCSQAGLHTGDAAVRGSCTHNSANPGNKKKIPAMNRRWLTASICRSLLTSAYVPGQPIQPSAVLAHQSAALVAAYCGHEDIGFPWYWQEEPWLNARGIMGTPPQAELLLLCLLSSSSRSQRPTQQQVGGDHLRAMLQIHVLLRRYVDTFQGVMDSAGHCTIWRGAQRVKSLQSTSCS
jgi:hypothetical protein